MKSLTVPVLAAIVGAVYWQVISRPFVYDDWYIVYSIHTNDVATTIANAFIPFDKLTYRPVAMVYSAVVFKCLG